MQEFIPKFKAKLCPECHSSDLERYDKRAETCCHSCGLVIDNRVLSLTFPYFNGGIYQKPFKVNSNISQKG